MGSSAGMAICSAARIAGPYGADGLSSNELACLSGRASANVLRAGEYLGRVFLTGGPGTTDTAPGCESRDRIP